MHLSENIVLRPRFQFQVSATKDELLAAFQNAKKSQKAYILSIVDDHIFIKIPKQKQHFWSPQLHLELRTNEDSGLMLHGLFGPNPTVWTLFMFLHFVVATLFIGLGAWAYSNYALDQSYRLQLVMMFVLIGIWFTLYFAGRMGKKAGRKETNELYSFMQSIVSIP
ncbi:MAG TPA: GTP-binding protein [Flavobacteriaceae bacterium]|jgi:hypothetical protein|nr:GTP-binding protein [Flavobacteriaceae bacterium]HBR54601.1 GTP-binding protein [Flavobacteriaceae bacterium]|tara:strand:+ start:12883 stop:13380 length:498 start_codon:yes stop_codon:yes gene_type:complete